MASWLNTVVGFGVFVIGVGSSVVMAILAGVFFWEGVVFFEQEQETCPCAPQKKHRPSLLYRSLSALVTALDRLALVSMALDVPPLRGLNSPRLFYEKNGFFAFFLAKKARRWGSMLVRIACLLRVDNFHCSQLAGWSWCIMASRSRTGNPCLNFSKTVGSSSWYCAFHASSANLVM